MEPNSLKVLASSSKLVGPASFLGFLISKRSLTRTMCLPLTRTGLALCHRCHKFSPGNG
jgi:hypothetical protein